VSVLTNIHGLLLHWQIKNPKVKVLSYDENI
jgi:hypothetical protein